METGKAFRENNMRFAVTSGQRLLPASYDLRVPDALSLLASPELNLPTYRGERNLGDLAH